MTKDKMSYMQFITLAIDKLSVINSKGIHTVFSGFNEAFREYYNEDPVEVTQMLSNEGKIELQYRRGGPMIYLAGDAPPRKSNLQKMLAED